MSNLNPLAYTGTRYASTSEAGLVQIDSNDFTVSAAGKLSVKAGSVATADLADDAVTSAKLADDTIQYVEVALTNAEIKGIFAAPKELVAAPGAGYCLEFVSALLKLNAGSEVLTESSDNMAIRYTDGSGVIVSQAIEATGFIDQAADTYTNSLPKIDAIAAATGCENKALVLDNTGSGEYAGNASNDATMAVGVAYRIHQL